jgi:hypothetical protein
LKIEERDRYTSSDRFAVNQLYGRFWFYRPFFPYLPMVIVVLLYGGVSSLHTLEEDDSDWSDEENDDDIIDEEC